MKEIKQQIENNISTINAQIVDVQRNIDKLFDKKLDKGLTHLEETTMLSLKETKFHHYGWLGSLEYMLKSVNKKLNNFDSESFIKEMETHDSLEESTLCYEYYEEEQLEQITERELRGDI